MNGAVADPRALRARGLACPPTALTIPGDATYRRTYAVDIPELHGAVRAASEGQAPLRVVGSAFRLNYGGELPNNWVHADRGYGSLAAVLYLSLPEHCTGGTAFWRHRSGIDRLPAEAGDEHQAVRDFVRISRWRQTQVVPMAFNRLILYPTQLFHSRWPFQAFGTGPQDGRLIAVGFYE